MLREEELAEQLPRAPLRLVAAQPASLAALRLVPVRHRLAHEGEHPLLAVVHLQALLRVVPVHHLAAATGTGRMRRRGAAQGGHTLPADSSRAEAPPHLG